MKRLTIMETRNGVLVVDGDQRYLTPEELVDKSWSFCSLDKAVTQVRTVLKGWRDGKAAKAKGGDDV